MKKQQIYVLLGEFTFLDIIQDGEYKTIINTIDSIRGFDTEDEAVEFGEDCIAYGMSSGYLIPQLYGGDIEMLRNKPISVWEFDEVSYKVVKEDDSENVFNTNELSCPKEVIQNVVNMHNLNKDLSEIDNYLLDEEDITTEDREVIIEGVYKAIYYY